MKFAHVLLLAICSLCFNLSFAQLTDEQLTDYLKRDRSQLDTSFGLLILYENHSVEVKTEMEGQKEDLKSVQYTEDRKHIYYLILGKSDAELKLHTEKIMKCPQGMTYRMFVHSIKNGKKEVKTIYSEQISTLRFGFSEHINPAEFEVGTIVEIEIWDKKPFSIWQAHDLVLNSVEPCLLKKTSFIDHPRTARVSRIKNTWGDSLKIGNVQYVSAPNFSTHFGLYAELSYSRSTRTVNTYKEFSNLDNALAAPENFCIVTESKEKVTWVVKNQPAMMDGNFIHGILNVDTWSDIAYISFPLFNTGELYSNKFRVNNGYYYNQAPYLATTISIPKLEELVHTITDNEPDTIKKIKKIYDYVKRTYTIHPTVSFNINMPYSCPMNNDLYVHEATVLLCAMVKVIYKPCYLMYTGDKYKPTPLPEQFAPNLLVLSCCAVKFGEGYLFLNLNSNYAPFGKINARYYNGFGMILANEPEFIDLDAKEVNDRYKTDFQFNWSNDSTVLMSMTCASDNYSTERTREYLDKKILQLDNRPCYWAKNSNKRAILREDKYDNITELDSPLVEHISVEYTLKRKNDTFEIPIGILSLEHFGGYDDTTRSIPFETMANESITRVYTFKIPKGLRPVEPLVVKNSNFLNFDLICTSKYTYDEATNTLVYKCASTKNRNIIQSSELSQAQKWNLDWEEINNQTIKFVKVK